MHIIAAVLSFLLTSSDDAEALRRTAPDDLTADAALAHLSAARFAAVIYNIDADMLLSTAYYESRYVSSIVGPVVAGKTACGVLQPTMETKCAPQSVLNDYLDGAKHLQGWYHACGGNERCALLGYGGGYALIKGCAEGPVMRVRGGRDVDICTIPDIRQFRARWIKKERTKHSNS